MKKNKGSAAVVLAAAAGWLVVWQIAGILLKGSTGFAGPLETAAALAGLPGTEGFVSSFASLILSTAAGMILGTAAGLLAAFAAFRIPPAKSILSPLRGAFSAIPAAALALLFLLLNKDVSCAAIVSFLAAFPAGYGRALTSADSVDRKLVEMAEVYRVPSDARLKYIYLPGMRASLAEAVRSSLNSGWKAGIAAETVRIAMGGAGAFRPDAAGGGFAQFLAWTCAAVIVCRIFEELIMLVFGLVLPKGKEDDN